MPTHALRTIKPRKEKPLSQDVTSCPRCARRTPAARGECIYCGESLPFSRINAAPPQRNIDTNESVFNTVLEPPSANPNESVIAQFASALQIEPSEARAVAEAHKPVPLARSQTRSEAEMIAALIRTCGLRATVIPDEDLSLDRELIRARRLSLSDDRIAIHHSGGDLSIATSEVKLLVIGGLRNTRVDYTEGISGGRGNIGNVLDSSEYRSEETLVDCYADRVDRSFRIKSDAFDYSGMVAPLSFRADLNFHAALDTLRSAMPHVAVDNDFGRMSRLLDRAWPVRTKNEPRGIKRTGLAFRAVAQATLTSDNRDQFERYSRLMFLYAGLAGR